MRKIRAVLLIRVTLLSWTVVSAQKVDDGKDQYLTWKKEKAATLQDFDHLYTFRIGIALKRTDSTHAHILIAVLGRTPNYYFVLQPIQTAGYFDTDADQNKTGKPKEWGAGQDTSIPRLGYLLEFDETIECEEDTNAVFVDIRPVPNKGQAVETTRLKAIFPLDAKWHFEEKKIFAPITQPE